MTERAYLTGLINRTRAARERLGISQARMADLLRVDRESYRMYERRTPLPHFLIESFCALTGIEVHEYVTGKRATMVRTELVATAERAEPPAKRAAERRRATG